ncbi:site-2 protease family protein [bacterium]|nr:site-2 protease family protein [bacterium]
MDIFGILISVSLLLFAVIFHEVAHAVVAEWFGDPTARRAGRITANPIPHLDPIGSLLLPIGMALVGSPVWFGWAKPVPINSYFLKNPVRDMMWIALAGPLSNVTLAVLTSAFLRLFLPFFGVFTDLVQVIGTKFILLNLGLAVFNLFPIPPLDGSRIISPFLPVSWQRGLVRLEPYGFLILFVLLYFGFLTGVMNFILVRVVPFFIE